MIVASERRTLASWIQHDGYMIGQLHLAVARALSLAGCRGGTRVIDIGSGSQPYASLVASLGGTYTPCDIGPGKHVQIQPGRPIALPVGYFDVGLSVQVLEHVWDIQEYIDHFRRHLTPTGRLILSTHGVWLYHPHPTDYRRWTRDGLVMEMESRGLRVEHVAAILGPMAWTTQIRSMGYIHLLQRAGSIGRVVSRLIALLMNARMWLEDRVTPEAIRTDNACVYVLVCSRGDT